jgi:hypothetical protein
MNGLRQIEVITQGNEWQLVGLDDQGRVWFGTTLRTAKGRGLTWVLMDETREEPAPTSSPAPATEQRRPWASR